MTVQTGLLMGHVCTRSTNGLPCQKQLCDAMNSVWPVSISSTQNLVEVCNIPAIPANSIQTIVVRNDIVQIKSSVFTNVSFSNPPLMIPVIAVQRIVNQGQFEIYIANSSSEALPGGWSITFQVVSPC